MTCLLVHAGITRREPRFGQAHPADWARMRSRGPRGEVRPRRIAVAVCFAMLAFCFGLFAPAPAMADGTWEYLGPSDALYPNSFFVTENALYLGLSSGLYRYPFATGEWELIAWGGSRVHGVAVWGAEDSNIIVLRRQGGTSYSAHRSMDGGVEWQTLPVIGASLGLVQSPCDSSRLFIRGEVPQYSIDGGWTWSPSSGTGGASYDDASFDPGNAHTLYASHFDNIWTDYIDKSTDGGATWSWTSGGGSDFWEIDAERARPHHVMTTKIWIPEVYVSADGGETWFDQAAPGPSRAICCPVWSPASFFVAGCHASWTSYAVWETSDLGATWTPHTEGLPTLEGVDWSSADMFLVSHPTEPILFAALEGWGVWRLSLNPASVPPPSAADGSGLRLFVHPNPTPGEITYTISLPQAGPAVLRLFDVGGHLLETREEDYLPAGRHDLFRSGPSAGAGGLPNGVYFLRVDSGSDSRQQRFVVAR